MGPGINVQIIESSDNRGYLLTYTFMYGWSRQSVYVIEEFE